MTAQPNASPNGTHQVCGKPGNRTPERTEDSKKSNKPGVEQERGGRQQRQRVHDREHRTATTAPARVETAPKEVNYGTVDTPTSNATSAEREVPADGRKPHRTGCSRSMPQRWRRRAERLRLRGRLPAPKARARVATTKSTARMRSPRSRGDNSEVDDVPASVDDVDQVAND